MSLIEKQNVYENFFKISDGKNEIIECFKKFDLIE
jgi:hypothetical protein